MRTIALLALFALVGCTNTNPSLVVLGSMVPSEANIFGCLFDPEDPKFVLSPTLNVAPISNLANQPEDDYQPVFLVQNQRVRRPSDLSPNTADVMLQFAQVELLDAAGTPLVFAGLPNPFRLPVPGFSYVPSAADGETPGAATIGVTLVPTVYQSGLTDGYIIAEAKFFGVGVDGEPVESSPFRLTIEICRGDCLFLCADTDAEPITGCTVGHDYITAFPELNGALGCGG